MNEEKYTSLSPECTFDFGVKLVEEGKIKLGDIVALYGDLGAGKTALSKGIAKGFGVCETVTSPTFSIVNSYEIKNVSNNHKILSAQDKSFLYHFDMYRIETEDDLHSLDFYDYLGENSVILVEWFENIESFFDEDEKSRIKKIKIIKDEKMEEKREIFL